MKDNSLLIVHYIKFKSKNILKREKSHALDLSVSYSCQIAFQSFTKISEIFCRQIFFNSRITIRKTYMDNSTKIIDTEVMQNIYAALSIPTDLQNRA